MLTLQNTTSMTATEICIKELTGIPGHIRGRSVPKKQLLSLERSRDEMHKQKQRAEEAEKKAAALAEQVTIQNSKIEKLEEMHKSSDEKIEAMMGQIALLVKLQSGKNVCISTLALCNLAIQLYVNLLVLNDIIIIFFFSTFWCTLQNLP